MLHNIRSRHKPRIPSVPLQSAVPYLIAAMQSVRSMYNN